MEFLGVARSGAIAVIGVFSSLDDRSLWWDAKLFIQFRLPFKVPLYSTAIDECAIGAHNSLQVGRCG
jgi:hypothetical protein